MSERVRIYVGERLTDMAGRQKPTIAFDLMPGVELVDALRELVGSMDLLAIAKANSLQSKPPGCAGERG